MPAGVALIDSPGHGERRLAGSSDAEYLSDVRRRMVDPAGDAALTAEWSAVATTTARRRPLPVVGTDRLRPASPWKRLFGLSIVADLPGVHAAVLRSVACWSVKRRAGSANATPGVPRKDSAEPALGTVRSDGEHGA